ncbi:MAG: hypothetical protein ABI873_16265 [Marmoricola sp.]
MGAALSVDLTALEHASREVRRAAEIAVMTVDGAFGEVPAFLPVTDTSVRTESAR